jgi:hypothetical protein
LLLPPRGASWAVAKGGGHGSQQGLCACGAAQLEVEGAPLFSGVCHCDNCKRRTGSAFGWSVYVRDEQIVDRSGEFAAFEVREGQTRHFCARCGATLYWKVDAFGSMTGIAGGCFGDDAAMTPSATVNNDQRLHWVGLPDDWATTIPAASA